MRRSSLRSADGGVRSWCGVVCSREKGFSFWAAYLAPASRPVSSEQIGLRWVVLLAAGWGWSGGLTMLECRFYNLERGRTSRHRAN